MQENPWNQRRPRFDHFREFRHLIDLQFLTRAWHVGLEFELPKLPVALANDVNLTAFQKSLAVLERLSGETPTDLDSLLDDQTPDELLSSLERKVWAVHAWTLIKIQEEETSENRSSIRTILRQLSWASGREAARRRWPNEKQDEWGKDLRALLTAAQATPFLKMHPTPSFFVKRAMSDEITILLLRNPYLSEFQESLEIAPDLYPLHEEWLKGFLFHLNSKIRIESTIGAPGLRTELASNLIEQRWSLHDFSLPSER